jgi:hypothetical protein
MLAQRVLRGPTATLVLLLGVLSCKEKEPPPTGLVTTDAAVTTSTPVEAGAVDLAQCAGCQLAPEPAWTFEGVYADNGCTQPLAQLATPSCAVVPALGSVTMAFIDEVGTHKAGESGQVTLTGQVAPEMPRFRKTAKACVKVNEGAVGLTPMNCAGQRVCSDATGVLTCGACRTFASGCPDFQETRMYATIDDPGAKGAKPATGGGGNLARLMQCCAALEGEAKRLGSSPEAGVLSSAAAQCKQLVAAAGPSGNAPELGALRTVLAGRKVPAICAGF